MPHLSTRQCVEAKLIKEYDNIIKILKETNCKSAILYPEKLSFVNEEESVFSRQEKRREFNTFKFHLRETFESGSVRRIDYYH